MIVVVVYVCVWWLTGVEVRVPTGFCCHQKVQAVTTRKSCKSRTWVFG